MQSNLKLRSNLMLLERTIGKEYQFVPGDLVKIIYPAYADKRLKHLLTKQQLIEMEQTLVCCICKKACAGTCNQN